MRAEWDAQSALEQLHLDRMIDCAWRLARIAKIETGVLLALCQPPPAHPARDNRPALGQAYLAGSPALASLSRHERRIELAMREAQRELELALYARAMQIHPFYARNLIQLRPRRPLRWREEGPVGRNEFWP
jgi:hypothetical protein